MAHVLRYETEISTPEKINPQFSKVKIKVLYTGLNRNNTYFSKDTVENMLYSLPLIPIVGEWKEKNENFGGHGGKLEISDEGIQWIETTKPYGVIPSEPNARWETITEADGTLHEYLVCDGYLWTGRYPEAEKVVTDGANQSMEVNVNEGEWTNGYYTISDAVFSAFCILGKSENPQENVEPCFESASITAYSLNKDAFKQEFTQMVNELKCSLSTELELDTSNFSIDNNQEEGGNDVDKLALFTKFPTLTEEIVADLKANLDNYSYEELELQLTQLVEAQGNTNESEVVEEFSTNENTDEVEVEATEDFAQDNEIESAENVDAVVVEPESEVVESKNFQLVYELSFDDIRGKIYDIINPVDSDGNRGYKYWIMEVFQTYFIAEDSNTYENYYKFPYTVNEDETVSVGEPTEVFAKWLTADEVTKLEQLETTNQSLQAELDVLKAEKATAERAEKEVQIEELFANFDEFADEAEYQALKETAIDKDLAVIETELFALAGRKKFALKNKGESTRITIHNSNNGEEEPYGTASRYFNK